MSPGSLRGAPGGNQFDNLWQPVACCGGLWRAVAACGSRLDLPIDKRTEILRAWSLQGDLLRCCWARMLDPEGLDDPMIR